MYKRDKQMKIEDFVFPYGKLNPENEWGWLADLVPWDTAEERALSSKVCARECESVK